MPGNETQTAKRAPPDAFFRLISDPAPASLGGQRHIVGEVAAIALGRFRRTWELLYLLTARELKLRYQDTVLGFVWSVLKPLLLALVLYFALKQVVRIQVKDYQLVLISALFPWAWFQTSVLLAAPVISHNGNLIKKVHFPRYVLPFAVVTNNMVHFLLALPVITVFVVVSGYRPTAAWLVGIPMLALVELVLLMGIVLLISSLNVYLRDLEHLVEVFLNLLFYVTPIIYPLEKVPDKYQNLLRINPLASLIEAWRELFMYNKVPGLEALWPCLVFTIIAVAIGSTVFGRLERGFADAL
jgi:lipopolysaccharide transport system permease protein